MMEKLFSLLQNLNQEKPLCINYVLIRDSNNLMGIARPLKISITKSDRSFLSWLYLLG